MSAVSRAGRGAGVPIAPRTRLDSTWMEHAACASKPYLPWTAEPHEVSPFQHAAMSTTCEGCPVIRFCRDSANARHVDAGYWAGIPRDNTDRREAMRAALNASDTTSESTQRTGS